MKKQIIILFFLFIGITNANYAQQILDKFESAIIKYEEQDQKNGYQPGAILFTGSSSIRMWKSLTEDMSPMPVINRGFGGSTIPEVTYYADRIILPHHPKIIVFYCGENDLSKDEAKSELPLKSFKQFYH